MASILPSLALRDLADELPQESMCGVCVRAAVPDLVHGEGVEGERQWEHVEVEQRRVALGYALGEGEQQIGFGHEVRRHEEVGTRDHDAAGELAPSSSSSTTPRGVPPGAISTWGAST